MPIDKINSNSTNALNQKARGPALQKSYRSEGLEKATANNTKRGGFSSTMGNNPFPLPMFESADTASTGSATEKANSGSDKIYNHLSNMGSQVNQSAGGEFDLLAAINGMAQQSDSDYDSALSNLSAGAMVDANFQKRQQDAAREQDSMSQRNRLSGVLDNAQQSAQNEQVAQAATQKFNEKFSNVRITGVNLGNGVGAEADPMRSMMAISAMISGKPPQQTNGPNGPELNISRLLFTAQNIRNTMQQNQSSLALNMQQPMAKAANNMFGRAAPGASPGGVGGTTKPSE